MADTSRAAFLGGLGRSRRIGEALEDQYVSGISGFDPYAAYREQAQGAFNQFRRSFANQLSRLRGQQVGMGRLRTGFATADEDRLFLEMADRLNDVLAQGALQAAGLNLQRLGQMGDYAARQRDTALQGYFGDWATRYQQQMADRASKRQMWGNLIGAGLTGLGLALGGPAGGTIASGIGKAIGAIGSLFSDERLKMGARPIENALAAVRAIPGQTWEWNALGQALTGRSGPDAGVMAQDVAAAYPEAVAVDPATGALAVNYGTQDTSMVGLLTQAVRELDAKVNRLEAALLGAPPQMAA